MEDMNNDLKRDYEEQVNKLKKTDVSIAGFCILFKKKKVI